jgi:uncharacterized protein (DUF2237 family)
MTGWKRNGCCETGEGDMGIHVVCARVTSEFLEFSSRAANDLTSPAPQYGFAGLKTRRPLVPVRSRWKEALDAGVATSGVARSDARVGARMGLARRIESARRVLEEPRSSVKNPP